MMFFLFAPAMEQNTSYFSYGIRTRENEHGLDGPFAQQKQAAVPRDRSGFQVRDVAKGERHRVAQPLGQLSEAGAENDGDARRAFVCRFGE